MGVRVSGKHMEIGDAFRAKIEDHIEDAVTKYFDGGYSGQVTVEKASGRFTADCRVHLDTGVVLHATGQAAEPQAAYDAAGERIEKRLRRYKRRLRDHHAGANGSHVEVAYSVFDSVPDETEELPEDYAPTVVAESTKQMKTMSVAEAVLVLDMTDESVVVFRNAGNDTLNVVYRRHDGNIGWVDAANVRN